MPNDEWSDREARLQRYACPNRYAKTLRARRSIAGRSDIEGKVAQGSDEEGGSRPSFNAETNCRAGASPASFWW
jgi:hypothetical protein